MWFSKHESMAAIVGLVATLREELAGERAARAFMAQRITEMKLEHLAQLEESRRRLSISQANFEWLTVSHNQISAEVQALRNARSGVSLPPLEVQFRAPDPGPQGQPTPAARREVAEPTGVADLVDQGLSFDDVGDRAAAAFGLDGRTYDGSTVLLRE
jgi:hypothetical protein